MGGEGSELAAPVPRSAFCPRRRSRTVWLCRQKEQLCPKSPGASPSQAALPSLLSRLERRHQAQARRLPRSGLLLHFSGWQKADGEVAPSLTELLCLGFVPLETLWRMGRAHEMGSSEGPQSASRAAGCLDPCPTDAGGGAEMSKALASFLQDVHCRPVRPGWGWRPSQDPRPLRLLPPRGCLWPPGGPELHLALLVQCVLHTQLGAGLLGISKRSVCSLASVAPVAFSGVVQSRPCGACAFKYL